MKTSLTICLTTMTLLMAMLVVGPAQALFIKRDLPVNQISATSFEVIEAYGEGPSGIWCAAADFAIKRLGKTSGRLYVETPRGPSVTQPGAKGVVFSTLPIPGVEGRATNSISERGANLRVAHAIQFCRDYIIELHDLS